ncbi:dynein axonemal intermediate chain 3 isoform X2 [Hypanus sabinus]|uniref:dynein axonemal intermediate chain 3 isoform X2 n=1 Tax=Hypanus sabinus TaxID=79690 RepID=UPI0028C4C563|nr:dynein axonemal intermediate chain 3 isoform X2 [Hypanus sabinus]
MNSEDKKDDLQTSRLSIAKDMKAFPKHSERRRSKTPLKSARKAKSAVFTEAVAPLYLTSKTQEIFQCVIDRDVTQEKPYKLIKKDFIINDMKTRAAVSDFHPYKHPIMDYQGDELLVVYDIDSMYGQNFYLALNEMMKGIILNSFEATENKTSDFDVVNEIKRKPWVDLGSGVEIEEEKFEEAPTKMKFMVSRIRRQFGAPVTLSDWNVADAKDSYVECASYQDKSFSIRKLERDIGIQAVPKLWESSTQTKWTYPRNACTQYTPREFATEEKEQLLKSEALNNFINSVASRFELALQQNEIMDVFYDDWKGLSEEDSTFGGKADGHLKEYQSFTDLQKSQGRRISSIEWHPAILGLVAVSVVDIITLEDRIKSINRTVRSHSYVLFWNFSDPIHPQIMLEAPDEIYCFQFCPTDTNIVAGGCRNGQVVLWDISEFAERLRGYLPNAKPETHKSNLLPELDPASHCEVPIARHCAVSSIENGHKSLITDLCWLPDHFQLTKYGVPYENTDGLCVQLITCSPDCAILFWDIRRTKSTVHSMQQKRKIEKELQNPKGVPNTFKHLDLHWKPMHQVSLPRIEGNGEYSPIRISMREKCTDRINEKSQLHLLKEKGENTEYSSKNVPSARDLTILTDINTFLFIGTEDGEVTYVDWQVEKDMDTGKMTTPSPTHCYAVHDGPVNTVQRSPFFRDIILTVGGWTIAVWKEGATVGPLLHSACQDRRCTTGHWSLSRPGVFIIGKEDGNIDIWDLLEKTHEPLQTQNISSVPISCMKPCIVSQKQHLLAVSDDFGTLHILEVPWSLRHPLSQEKSIVEAYFEKEVKRLNYFGTKKLQRAEKIEKEDEKKQAPPDVEAKKIEQIEEEMKKEYSIYLNEEKKAIIAQLGMT